MKLFRNKYFLLFLIVALAVVLRLIAIDGRSLWGDEVDSVFKAHDFESSGYKYVRSDPLKVIDYPIKTTFEDGRQTPLYFILLSIWIDLLGPSSLAMRSLSVMLGVLAVVLAFLFASEFFDTDVSLLAALFFAFSPFNVLYSQEIRVYALLAMVSIISTWSLMKLLFKEETNASYLCYVLSSIVLTYVHFYGVLFIASQIIVGLLIYWLNRSPSHIIRILYAQAFVIIAFLPWAVFGAVKNAGLVLSGEAVLPYALYNFAVRGGLYIFALFLGESIAPWNYIAGLGAFVGLILFIKFIIENGRSLNSKEIACFLMVIVPVLLSLLLKNTLPKYLITCSAVLMIFAAFTVMKFRNVFFRASIILLILLAYCVSLNNYYHLREMHNSNLMEPWSEITSEIAANYRPGDRVFVNDQYVAFREMEYYLNIIHGESINIDLVERGLSGERIFLVLSIYDENQKSNIKEKFMRSGYWLVSRSDYVPYDKTLAAKLPRRLHRLGQSRVEVYLYSRKG